MPRYWAFLMTAALLTMTSLAEAAAPAGRKTEQGRFVIEMQAASPLKTGSNSITLTVHGGAQPVEAAVIEVTPWMTIHSHGSPKKPRVKEKGNGIYVVDDVYLTMAGDWDLIITIRKGDSEDSAVIPMHDVK